MGIEVAKKEKKVSSSLASFDKSHRTNYWSPLSSAFVLPQLALSTLTTSRFLPRTWSVKRARDTSKLSAPVRWNCLHPDSFPSLRYAIEILNEGRIGIAAQMVGLAQGAFNKSVPYTFQRKQFGQAVGSFQGMQMQFAEVATEIEAARLLTYNAARMKEEGKDFVQQAAMAKWYASVVAQKASGMAIEWAGGVGFTRETGIEKYWRDSKVSFLFLFGFPFVRTVGT